MLHLQIHSFICYCFFLLIATWPYTCTWFCNVFICKSMFFYSVLIWECSLIHLAMKQEASVRRTDFLGIIENFIWITSTNKAWLKGQGVELRSIPKISIHNRQNDCILWTIATIVFWTGNGKFILWQNEYNFALCFPQVISRQLCTVWGQATGAGVEFWFVHINTRY